MASLRAANRVKETTSSTGTGTINLNGAATGFQTFVLGIGNGNACIYLITNGINWEVGIGTVTSGSPDTLSRDTVLSSSNGGAKVNFPTGNSDVMCVSPAEFWGQSFRDSQTITGTTKTISVAENATLFVADATSNAITFTPPAIANVWKGFFFGIKRKDATANAVTLDPNASETVDGQLTRTINGQYTTETYVFNGTEWSVIVSANPKSRSVSPRTSNTILAAADQGTVVLFTSGTFSQTFTAAATLGAGWWVILKNGGTGVITLDPNASETIDGATTVTLNPGAQITVVCDGTNFRMIEGWLPGLQTIWLPARAFLPRTTTGCSALTSLETATNKNNIEYLGFDPSTQQYAQALIEMPKSWDRGSVFAQFLWSHPSTTTNFGVAWSLAGVAKNDGEALDAAFGTAQQVNDTGGTTDTKYISNLSSGITIAGTLLGSGNNVQFQLSRVAADVNDTLAVIGRLHGVLLFFNNAAQNDS